MFMIVSDQLLRHRWKISVEVDQYGLLVSAWRGDDARYWRPEPEELYDAQREAEHWVSAYQWSAESMNDLLPWINNLLPWERTVVEQVSSDYHFSIIDAVASFDAGYIVIYRDPSVPKGQPALVVRVVLDRGEEACWRPASPDGFWRAIDKAEALARGF